MPSTGNSGPAIPTSVPRRRSWRWGVVIGLLGLGLGWWWLPNIPTPRAFEHWPEADSGWTRWEPWYQGVEYARANFSLPRPMKAHALRIDLQAPGLEIVLTPPLAEGSTNYRSQFATDFIRRQDLAVAVSGGQFWPQVRWPGLTIRPVGVMVTDGVRWSPPVGNLHALVFTKDHRVRLTRDQTRLTNVWQAMGGNLIILQQGTNLMEAIPPTSTSVVGHSPDGRILYWLVVDGRQPGWSEGASPIETAEMMKTLGASDALRMDGGSVVTLARSGFLGAKVINRPSHPYITGVQRPIGSLVGIRARTLTSSP